MQRLVPVFLCALAIPSLAAAHPAPFSYLDVVLGERAVDVTVVAHVFDLAHDLKVEPADSLLDPARLAARRDDLVALLLPRIQLAADDRELACRPSSAPEVIADRQSIRVHLACGWDRPAGSLRVQAALFPYDPAHQTFLNVYEQGELQTQAILERDRASFEYFAGTRHGALAVVRRFVLAGLHHIVVGPDHLLFLFGLLLLGGALRQLALMVTAFTLAHSLTLSLAVLAVFSPSARLVEPAIALSVVYVGADNLLARGGRDLRAWIAFGFGLVHGFGFASVLREMDLPRRALGWSLFSFNVGVEIGQLLVVLAVASALAAVRARSEQAGRRFAVAGSIVVIGAGTFWFVQRLWLS
jgi:hydrogenase/urease accessory protein HupE